MRTLITALAFVLSAGAAQAGYSVLHAFTGGSDGAYPSAGLIMDSGGNLYGTTAGGGGGSCNLGCGTVFKLAPDGTETVLHAFTGGDGALPLGDLIQDSAGDLYGTTKMGDSGDCELSKIHGCGTVFELAPDGTETVLHAFTGGNDGAFPVAGVTEDKAGNLYGTTFAGGANCQSYACGTVFEIAADGTETVLHSFGGGTDGGYVYSRLRLDETGNLYGTTYQGGGTACYGYGCGIVFELAPDGTENVLHAFTGGDGAYPEAGVIKDEAGNLYGTMKEGGSGLGYGTVFKLTPEGKETVLHSFTGGSDGTSPLDRLIRDKAGNLYGTTIYGGSNGCNPVGYRHGCGTVFMIAPDGTETVLYAFANSSKNGGHPYGRLHMDDAGNLYGTTKGGGSTGCGCGVVFKFSR